VDDPNVVPAMSVRQSAEHVQPFVDPPDLREKMKDGGVHGRFLCEGTLVIRSGGRSLMHGETR